jgi:hypothetical protein
MAKAELTRQLDEEIERIATSLAYWRSQAQLQADSPLVATVTDIADRFALQLQQLEEARDVLRDA